MTLAKRRAAARNGGVAIALALLMPASLVLAADPLLTLPLAVVVGLSLPEEEPRPPSQPTTYIPRPPVRRTTFVLAGGGLPPPQPGLLPSRLHIPDAYEVDCDREIRQYVAPIDSDRMVSLDLIGRPRRGWKAFVAYDSEDRGPFPGGGNVLSVVAEYHFH